MLIQIMLRYKCVEAQGFSFMCKDIILLKVCELQPETKKGASCQ